jgi:murein DD-endopeptidase MepM/ murein hydrolase activator NlpD
VKPLAVLAVAAVLTSPVALVGGSAALMLAAGASGSESAAVATSPVSCAVGADPAVTAAGLDAEQVANAQVFIAEGKRRGLAPVAIVAALAAGKVESEMRNLDYGHGTSVGVLQLIDDHGSARQRLDPLFSVSWFYDGVQTFTAPGYAEMPVGALAQRQQRSAFPLEYAKEEGWATAVYAALEGTQPGTCAPLAAGPWTHPLAPGTFTLTSGFGPRRSPGGIGSRNHAGLDYGAPTGTPVFSASAGRVSFVGNGGGYGNLVRVIHADGVETFYAHLSATAVTQGDDVQPGAPLGAVGSTGSSTGPHLHFEVRINGVPTDPRPWLTGHGVPEPGAAA